MNFKTILIDPPWLEIGGGKIKRGADKHYSLMNRYDILKTIICCDQWRLIDKNSHLYMWTTNSFLVDALWLIDSLGYKYKTNIVWVKKKNENLQMGLGQYFRGSHEILLFATKGKKPTEPKTELKNIKSVIEAPRTIHSKKPELAFNTIEKRSKGPYLEIFAREKRPNWVPWGNEL